MRKIIKLTESDLTRIVKRIINEQSTGLFPGETKLPKPIKVKVGIKNVNLTTVKVMKESTYVPNDLCAFKGLSTDGNTIGVLLSPKAPANQVEYLENFTFDSMRKMFDKSGKYIPKGDYMFGDEYEDAISGDVPVPYSPEHMTGLPTQKLDSKTYSELLQACPVKK